MTATTTIYYRVTPDSADDGDYVTVRLPHDIAEVVADELCSSRDRGLRDLGEAIFAACQDGADDDDT